MSGETLLSGRDRAKDKDRKTTKAPLWRFSFSQATDDYLVRKKLQLAAPVNQENQFIDFSIFQQPRTCAQLTQLVPGVTQRAFRSG